MYCNMHENFFPHVELVCAGGGNWGCAVEVNNLLIVCLGIVNHYKLHVNITRLNCQIGSANRMTNQGGHRVSGPR